MFAAALVTPVLADPSSAFQPARLGPNVEVFGQWSNRRVLGGLEALVPIWQDPRGLAFAEIKGHASDQQSQEINVGLGLRRLVSESDWILGAFAQYDRRVTRYSNAFDQLTLGLESLGPWLDLRLRYYNPFTDPQRVQGWVGGIQFRGYRTFTQETFEEALGGWDAEVGLRLPIDEIETRVYAGGYSLDGDLSGHTNGWSARLEVRPIKRLALELGYREDDLLGGETTLTLRYAFGYGPGRGVRTQRERLIEPTRRDIDVLVTPPDVTPRQDVVLVDNTIHIDSARGMPAGDGSYERPYRTVEDCLLGRCSARISEAGGPGSMIRLWQGSSTQGSPYRLSDTWWLNASQILWGEGWQVETHPTRTPVYSGWLANGSLVPGVVPWVSPPQRAAGIAVLQGGAVSGVAVDVLGPAQQGAAEGGNGTPALIVDGDDDVLIQGNLFLTDVVGIQVLGMAASASPGAAAALPPAPGSTLAVAWGLTPGSPIQTRVLDNLVLVPQGDLLAASDQTAVSLVNLAGAGEERVQTLVFRAGVPGTVPAGMATPANGIWALNQAEGAGAHALQRVLILDAGLDLGGNGIDLTNVASDGAMAEQDIRLFGGRLSGEQIRIAGANRASGGARADQVLVLSGQDASALRAGLDVSNQAESGAIASQRLDIETNLGMRDLSVVNRASGGGDAIQGVRLVGASIGSGAAGRMLIENAAESGGRASQGIRIEAASIRLDQGGLIATNAASSGGAAIQELALDAADGSLLARIDLSNQASGLAAATQAVAISGLDVRSPAGMETWIGAVNAGLDQGQAVQRLGLDLGVVDLRTGGAFLGNGAYGGSQATQEVRLHAASGSLAWLSVFNQGAADGAADQRIDLSGLSVVQAADGDGAIEAVSGAFGGSSANQALSLDLAAAALPGSALRLRNRAEQGSSSAQGLALTVGGEADLRVLDIDQASKSDSRARQALDLALASAATIERLVLGNVAAADSAAHQGLSLGLDRGGLLGDLRLANSALTGATAVQTLDGDGLPLLNTSGWVAASNASESDSAAYQSVALDLAPSRLAGAKAMLLDNGAESGSDAVQTLTLGGSDDIGAVGALVLGNQSGTDAFAGQAADIRGLAVSAAYTTYYSADDGWTSRGGVNLENTTNLGRAQQTVVLDTGAASLDAAWLEAYNQTNQTAIPDAGPRAVEAVQTLSVHSQTGGLGYLSLSNQGRHQGRAAQDLDLAVPGLGRGLGFESSLYNSADTDGQAVQLARIESDSIASLGLRISNNGDAGGSADQSWSIRTRDVAGTGSSSNPDLALKVQNRAGSAAEARQIGHIHTDAWSQSGGDLVIGNDAQGGEAGQLVALEIGGDAPGMLGALAQDNSADQAGSAAQGVSLEAVELGSGLAVGNLAFGLSSATQDLTLAGALSSGALAVTNGVDTRARAEQALSIQGDGSGMLDDLAFDSTAAAGGVAIQSAVVSGVNALSPGIAARVHGSAASASSDQIIDLDGVGLTGGSDALSFTAAAESEGTVTQQLTLTDSILAGRDVEILVDPTAPSAGLVNQHLALWDSNARVRFEPTVIHSLDELSGIHQTFMVDGVRQPIWRRLILPDGSSVWVDENGETGDGPGDGGSGSGSGSSGSVTISDSNSTIIGEVAPAARPLNLGDLLGGDAATYIDSLGLPSGAALSPGALRYLADLHFRGLGNPAAPLPASD